MKISRRNILIILVIGLWFGFRNCSILEFRMSDEELLTIANETGVPAQVVYTQVKGHRIRYFKAGADSLPKLICLHGSPSSLSGWKSIFADTAFTRHYQVVAIDRPGYGYSDFGDVETDLQKQIALIQPVVEELTGNSKSIIFGSSYGGPVAAQLAMNLPNRFSQLVLLSSSLQPHKEKTYWISYAMVLPVLKHLFPTTLRMASEEKLSHHQQLKTINNWQKIKTEVLIIHGNKDDLIYYDNALYAKTQVKNAKKVKFITMNGKGHAIIFSQPAFLKTLLLQNLVK